MAWERRQRGGKYFYTKEREGGRVTSRYIGTGEVAACIAQFHALERQSKEDEREAERERRAQIAQKDAQNAAYFDEVEALFRQVMEAAGYHRHKRGKWRKRRERQADCSQDG